MNTNTSERVKTARLLTALSRKDFCDKHKININTLQSLELGRLSLSNKNAILISNALANEGFICSKEWLLSGKGFFPTKERDLNLNVHIKNLNINDNDEIALLREINFFKKNNKDHIVTVITDDGMSPLYQTGDFIGGRKINNKNLKNFINQPAIIEIKNKIFTVRHISFNEEKQIYMLSCINPKAKVKSPIIYLKNIKSLSSIIWIRKPFLNNT